MASASVTAFGRHRDLAPDASEPPLMHLLGQLVHRVLLAGVLGGDFLVGRTDHLLSAPGGKSCSSSWSPGPGLANAGAAASIVTDAANKRDRTASWCPISVGGGWEYSDKNAFYERLRLTLALDRRAPAFSRADRTLISWHSSSLGVLFILMNLAGHRLAGATGRGTWLGTCSSSAVAVWLRAAMWWAFSDSMGFTQRREMRQDGREKREAPPAQAMQVPRPAEPQAPPLNQRPPLPAGPATGARGARAATRRYSNLSSTAPVLALDASFANLAITPRCVSRRRRLPGSTPVTSDFCVAAR